MKKQTPSEGQATPIDGGIASPRTRLEMAVLGETLRAKRLANNRMEDRLIERSDVAAALAPVFVYIRNRIEAIPGEVEMLIPAEVRQPVKREIEDKLEAALRELSEIEI